MGRRAHIPRVYIDTPLAVGETIALPEAKRHHLVTVLRLGAGAPLVLFNGDGAEYDARLATADRKQASAELDARREPVRESPLDLTLFQAIARGDRMDFALAKAVELGVTRLVPVFAERGKIKLAGERLAKKQAHWQRAVESAAEQSGRLILPVVEAARPLAEALAVSEDGDTAPAGTAKLMLAFEKAQPLSQIAPASAAWLLVGPESGLSSAEVAAGRAAGWRALALGPRVLRTETAGMAAIAVLQGAWGDLGGAR